MREENSSTEISTTWIENLAIEEFNMNESGVINFNDHLNPDHHLEESSIDLMERLRERFEIYTTKFNEFRGDHAGSHIKIFKISGTVNDFMLFRNSLRLIVARKSHDLISVGFLSNSGGLFSPRSGIEGIDSSFTHEIKAHIGPFNNISWRFKGEEINIDSMIRHYLSEFVRNSSR